MSRIELANDKLKLEVDTRFGASITQLLYQHEASWFHIMRPAPDELKSSSDANFVLAPYSNRIRDGKFSFEGQQFQLKFPEKHAIHGDIRNRPMTVESQTEQSLCFQLKSSEHDDFNFPFELDFQVEYRLEESSLVSILRICNSGNTSAPVGGGFHPYFLRCPSAKPDELRKDVSPQIKFSAEGVYLYPDSVPIPSQRPSSLGSEYDYRELQTLGASLDNEFSGWDGNFEFLWKKTQPPSEQAILGQITSSENCRELIVYSPASNPSFAVEPVSNVTDAFNLRNEEVGDFGTVILSAKEEVELRYELRLNSISA